MCTFFSSSRLLYWMAPLTSPFMNSSGLKSHHVCSNGFNEWVVFVCCSFDGLVDVFVVYR